MELSKLIRAPEVNPKAVELFKGNSKLIFLKCANVVGFQKNLNLFKRADEKITTL